MKIEKFVSAIGRKNDAEKPRLDLLCTDLMIETAKVLQHGAEKYGDDNWRSLPNARRRFYAALLRHTFAWWVGILTDKDSGLSHLAHVAACADILYRLENNK